MLIRNTARNPMEIEFKLNLIKERDDIKDEFCFSLNLKIKVDNKNVEYNNIIIDTGSLQHLFRCVKKFINNQDEEQLYYEPLESAFSIYIPRPLTNKKELIQKIISKGLDNEFRSEINKIENEDDPYKLFFLVDTQKLNKGTATGTGIAYCLQVTKSTLNEFINGFENEYQNLLQKIDL